jgi:CMP-N,N'-diacetyllegionaminic acid synthase
MNTKQINILCIIPARSGSKGLPDKNIMNFKGKPMLVWSIEQAQKCKYSNRIKIIVSTDSEKYAKIAREYGAETPFIRPTEISGDLSTDYECIKHCVEYLKEHENYECDIIMHLRPTQPCRKIVDINKCLDIFIENIENYDSLRSVIPVEKSPFKMYKIRNNNLLEPLFNLVNDIMEPYNQPRQVLPQTYLHNGYIDILKTEILRNNTISGSKIYPYIMNQHDNIDIDYEKDLIQ